MTESAAFAQAASTVPHREYPFPGHRLDIGGVQMHYLDEGPVDAPPVLMVHGNPTWSFYYRRLVMALRGRYRMIVPDHIGMGLSEKPPETRYAYTLERRLADLESLLDHLSLRHPLTLVVHDWGGMIGMAWAVKHPERVERLIVLNTAAFGLPPDKKMPWQLTLARTPLLGALLVRGCNAFSRGALRSCVVRPLPPEVAQGYLAPYDTWEHRLAVHRFIQDIPLRPGDRSFTLISQVERGLARLSSKPMLICWGMRDFVFDHHFLTRWLEHFPHADVHRFAQAGHYVLEDAADEIVSLVRSFLEAPATEAAAS